MNHPGYTGQNRFLARYSLLLLLSLGLITACGGGGSSKPTLSIQGTTVTEGDTGNVEMLFTVTLSKDAKSTLTLNYTSVDGSAESAENDYTPVSGQLTIPEGSRTATVPVIINGDDDFEADETVGLNVSNPQGLSLKQSSYTGTGTITNDDDAEPEGYYTGTANVNGLTLTVTAMAYDDRILMFNTDENVLYDITLNSVTLTDYSATVQVYANGDLDGAGSLKDLSLSGTTDEATISGTFGSSTGFGEGSFTLTFDESNNVGATFDRIVVTGLERWAGDIYGVEVSQGVGRFFANSDETYSAVDQGSPWCQYSGNLVIPESSLNIYQLAHDVVEGNNCEYISENHTGFASIISINGVETLVYAFAGGEDAGGTRYSLFFIGEVIG